MKNTPYSISTQYYIPDIIDNVMLDDVILQYIRDEITKACAVPLHYLTGTGNTAQNNTCNLGNAPIYSKIIPYDHE